MKVEKLLKDQTRKVAAESLPASWGLEPNDTIQLYELDLHLCQVKSLRGFPEPGVSPLIEVYERERQVGQQWYIVSLDASVNHIRRMRNLEALSPLRSLNLSTNQISSIKGLEELSNLRVLNLSNNDLSKIEGISFCHHLVELDLSINRIVRIEGLEELSQLEILRMNGNEVSVLEKLERLGKLRILEAMRNKICNIDHIAFITSIEELQLAENKLDDLDRVGKAVLNLKRLRTLTLNGNPIEQHRDYRLRVLENEQVMMLDSSEIKPQLRDHLDDMKKKQDLDEIVELTTNEYMARIEREQFRKTQSVNFFRAREKEIEDAFLEYRSQMERELEDCVSYIQGLSNRKDLLDRSFLATEDGMHEWRTMLDEAQRQRQEDTEAQEDQRKGNLRQEAVQQSAGMSFTGKLYELSFRRPDLWRRMKSMELKQTQMEEREQADEQRKLRPVGTTKQQHMRALV